MNAILERPTRHPLPTDEFVEMLDVPVFSEHTNREGVEIDEEALIAICKKCNDRISETGDYAPIVLRHTSDDKSSTPPEVIGFAGPYRMGRVGTKKPRAAIFAKFRIFKDDAHQVKKHPRRSVEFWASEDDPTCGYFDPISLLGAETPELDLGIRYERGLRGHRPMRYQRVERYEASFPGSSNTFVPSGTERKKTNYSSLELPDMNPEVIQQLVQALTPVIQATVKEAVTAATAPPPDMDVELDAPGGDPGLDAAGGEPPMPGTEGPELDDPGLDAPGGEPGLDAIGGDEEAPDHYAKMCGMSQEAESDKYFADLDDGGKTSVRTAIDQDGNLDRKTKMKKYMAQPESPASAAKYQKENGELRTRYAKLNREHTDLRTRYAKLEAETATVRAEKRHAVRYQKLSDIAAQGYVLEPIDELAETETLNDEQFVKHCDRIVTHYQRVQLGMLPVPKPLNYDGSTREAKSQKYAKQARDNVLAARAKGEAIEYGAELERLISTAS